jgi:pimeloyl-ACP methyl ester carboxylesterase
MQWTVEHGMVVRRTGGDGPRIVWIHGLGESSVGFEPCVAALPECCHVLVDLPGYGRSPWPDTAATLETVGAQLAAWLAEEPPAFVIGHSMGGVLATFVAERTRVLGVVNIDGNTTRGDCTFSAQAAAYSLVDFVDHGFATVRAQVYAGGADHPELRGYHAAMTFAAPHVFHQHSLDLVELSTSDTLGPRLAALSCPKLFVAGEPGGVCTATRERLTALGVRWVGLEPAGHWVHLDQLARFASYVRDFVTGS